MSLEVSAVCSRSLGIGSGKRVHVAKSTGKLVAPQSCGSDMIDDRWSRCVRMCYVCQGCVRVCRNVSGVCQGVSWCITVLECSFLIGGQLAIRTQPIQSHECAQKQINERNQTNVTIQNRPTGVCPSKPLAPTQTTHSHTITRARVNPNKTLSPMTLSKQTNHAQTNHSLPKKKLSCPCKPLLSSEQTNHDGFAHGALPCGST